MKHTMTKRVVVNDDNLEVLKKLELLRKLKVLKLKLRETELAVKEVQGYVNDELRPQKYWKAGDQAYFAGLADTTIDLRCLLTDNIREFIQLTPKLERDLWSEFGMSMVFSERGKYLGRFQAGMFIFAKD